MAMMSAGNAGDILGNDDCVVFPGVVGEEESEDLIRNSPC
jgi:hypothetical protein